jgi:hypothetical protein
MEAGPDLLIIHWQLPLFEISLLNSNQKFKYGSLDTAP